MERNQAYELGESADLDALWTIHESADALSASDDESFQLIGRRIRAITLQAIRTQDPWSIR